MNPLPFVELNEIVETAPHDAGYRQFKKTGRSLHLELLPDGGLDCKLTSGHLTLDASQRRALTDWLATI